MENLSVLAFPVGPSSSHLHPAHSFSRFEEPLCCCFWRWCSRRDYATASTESVEIRSCKCSDTKNATFFKKLMPNQLDMCFWPKCRQCYHQFTTWFCVAQKALVKIFATKYWFDTSKGDSCETTSRDHQSGPPVHWKGANNPVMVGGHLPNGQSHAQHGNPHHHCFRWRKPLQCAAFWGAVLGCAKPPVPTSFRVIIASFGSQKTLCDVS